ncbi:alpha-1,2-fucosyltransferase [Opitutus sp. ER46]|uniref:alpha-1,2-fucosyltransferase n=1 Tax=Opitutus sp. ER46 TaxID=2161864 RepID=UPI001304CF3A|nr:alpha-1,2-fucosyltransferase [Opitutus sp. ER46]
MRLHLGCGEKHFDGYVNVDYPPSEHTCQTVIGADVFADVTKLRMQPRSVDEIRLHHVFEHFKRSDALGMLIIWHEALKVGGRLHLETPDVLGCAQQLVSDAPFGIKQAVIRHCFGSQEAGWAIHYDGWSEEKYRHVLSRLGFSVETKTWRWARPPYLANVEAMAVKVTDMGRDELLAAADALLREYIVAEVPSELGMWDVWRRDMRAFLATALPVPQPPASTPEKAHAATLTEPCGSGPRKVVVKLQGGMGNQMFQYAAGLALARRSGAKLALDLSFLLDRTPRANFTYRDFDLDLFSLDRDCEILKGSAPASANLSILLERQYGFDSRFASAGAGVYLDGYWQSPRYFAEVISEVRRTFTRFTRPLDALQTELADRIASCSSVCLNVRRADYVTNPAANACHGVCTESYFHSAVRHIRSQIPDAHFFIFSDDVEWCRKADLVGDAPRTIVSHAYAGERFSSYLQLMMGCRHFIIPNSSFAWWAAFLGAGPQSIVIAPTPWFNDLATEYMDLMPAEWTLLSRNQGPSTGTGQPPLVSVLMLSHDGARFLPEAIGSVMSQTMGNLEVVVVAAGSTDKSGEVVTHLAACYPERNIKFVAAGTSQLAGCWNAGMATARGDYILAMRATDRLAPRALEQGTTALLKRKGCTSASGNTTPVQTGGGDRSRWQGSVPPCVLLRRDVALQTGAGRDGSEWNGWMNWASGSSADVHVSETWLYYRPSPEGSDAPVTESETELRRELRLAADALAKQDYAGAIQRIQRAVRPAMTPEDLGLAKSLLASIAKARASATTGAVPR